MISSLPGKPSRALVESCILEAEPGKLDIKRCKPGISISLLFILLAIMLVIRNLQHHTDSKEITASISVNVTTKQLGITKQIVSEEVHVLPFSKVTRICTDWRGGFFDQNRKIVR